MKRWYLYILLFLIAASYFGCNKANKWKGGYHVEGFARYSGIGPDSTLIDTTITIVDTLFVIEEDEQEIRIESWNSWPSFTLAYTGKDIERYFYNKVAAESSPGSISARCELLRLKGTVLLHCKEDRTTSFREYTVSGKRVFKW